MSPVIIVESCFGNTRRVAEAIADGLPGASLLPVGTAPTTLPEGTDLVLLGAPTHSGKLPSAHSRELATKRSTPGAREAREATGRPIEGAADRGLAEWIQTASIPAGTRVVTFDTTLKSAGWMGRASKDAVRRLKRTGVRAEQGESFWVTPTDELVEGEIARASTWAGGLAG